MTLPIESTSWLNPNGDRAQSKSAKIRYVIEKSIENILDSIPRSKKFHLIPQERFISRSTLQKTESATNPSRIYSNLFWRGINWKPIVETLGPLKMADIGCGNGNFSQKAKKWLGLDFEYYGFDVVEPKNWSGLHSKEKSFCQFDGENFQPVVAQSPNLIVSQSALEHIPSDARLLKTICRYTEQTEKPVLQIHLVPSASCLWTYLWHGYRQYPLGALNRIADIFNHPRHRISIIPLGGLEENWFHLREITIPEMLLKRRPRETARETYIQNLKKVLARGGNRGSIAHSAFIGIWIESNCNKSIL